MAEAPQFADWYRENKNRVTVITLLGQQSDNSPVDQRDVEFWVEDHGITHPVVADPDFGYGSNFFTSSNVIALPSMTLLDKGEVIFRDKAMSPSQVESQLR